MWGFVSRGGKPTMHLRQIDDGETPLGIADNLVIVLAILGYQYCRIATLQMSVLKVNEASIKNN